MLQLPHDNYHASQLDEFQKDRSVVFIANDETSKVLDPAIEPLDLAEVSVSPQFASVLSCGFGPVRSMWADLFDVATFEPIPQRIAICGAIINQSLRRLGQGLAIQQRFDQTLFGGAGAMDFRRYWNTLTIGQDYELSPLAALGVSHVGAPFFAREKAPSAIACDQAIRFKPSRCNHRRTHIAAKSPDSGHSCKRRQQVAGEGKHFGKSFQRAQARRLHKIPSKQALGAHGGRPPARVGRYSTNMSAIRSHCSPDSCDFGSVLDAVVPQAGPTWGDSVAFMMAHPYRRCLKQIACHGVHGIKSFETRPR